MHWYHYNSRRSRRPSTCPHTKEAKKLRDRVLEVLDQTYAKQNIPPHPKESSNIIHLKCPQQPDDSVDCA
ncbi:hypothetical protein FRX31_020856, partial [Thalictrum thalictroides]